MEPLAPEDPRAVGEYRLHARLGAGGMGQVYLGFSLAGRAVAVKVVHPELARDRAFVNRFRQEVAAAQAVNAAYTAPVVAAGLDDDPPWVATVFVPGPSLADALADDGPLPEAAVWKLAAGLVESLRAIHAAQLVHRDLKPQNVLLAVDGPRVIDFGISRALDSTALTVTGTVLGTPSFMSPEQAQAAPMGPASDVFSLGCVLAFAATTVSPFGQGDPAAVLYRIVHGPPALDGVPDRVRAFVAGCLAKRPEDRPALSQLAYAISTEVATDPGASPASFWPAAVTGLIRSYQARLGADGPAGDELGTGGAAYAREWADALPGPEARHPGATQTASPWQARPLTGRPARTGRHAAPARGSQAPAAGQPYAPWDARLPPGATGAPGRPAGLRGLRAGRQVPVVTRRQALTGLAGASAVGLAALGWELSQTSSPRPSAGAAGSRPKTAGRQPAARRQTTASKKTLSPGTQIWSFRTGNRVAADLAVAGGVVYVGSTDHSVYALHAVHGGKIWGVPTNGPVYSGPAVARGMVYVGSSDHNVYGYRAASGAEIWNYRTGDAVTSDPTVANGIVYVGSTDHNLYALNPASGAGLWAFRTHGPVFAQPALAVGVVLVASADDNVYGLHAHDGIEIWGGATGGPVYQGPVVADGVAYVGSSDHHVYGLRAASGPELWSHVTGGPVNSCPAVADGVVYVGSDDHHVYALSARNGAEIWKHPTGSQVQAGPVVADGVVYVGSHDFKLYALRASDGTKLWDFATGGPITSRAAVADGIVYVGSGDGRVYAVRA